MIISYQISKTIVEEKQMEIDINNCFLFCKRSKYTNAVINHYFARFERDGVFYEVEFRNVFEEFYLTTKADLPNQKQTGLETFLLNSKEDEVVKITEELFFKEYNELLNVINHNSEFQQLKEKYDKLELEMQQLITNNIPIE